jgi:hypothetical protein
MSLTVISDGLGQIAVQSIRQSVQSGQFLYPSGSGIERVGASKSRDLSDAKALTPAL